MTERSWKQKELEELKAQNFEMKNRILKYMKRILPRIPRFINSHEYKFPII